jgi:hypothetical protein
MAQNFLKKKKAQNGPKKPKMDKNDLKGSKIVQNGLG